MTLQSGGMGDERGRCINAIPHTITNQAVADPISAHEQGTYTHEGANNFRLRNVITQVVANPLTERMHKGVNTTTDEGQTMVVHSLQDTAQALSADGFDASEDGTGRGTPIIAIEKKHAFSPPGAAEKKHAFLSCRLPPGKNIGDDDGAAALELFAPPELADVETQNRGAKNISAPVAFVQNSRDEVRMINGDGGVVGALAAEPGAKQQNYLAYDLRGREGGVQFEGPHPTANIRAASGGASRSFVAEQWAVRRLTPTECERLQGFPDGYTAVKFRKKLAADGPRYKALGNSMAVNVMRLLGQRIALIDGIAAASATGEGGEA